MLELQLKLLGGFALRDRAGAELAVRSKKVRGLIAYLALNPDRRHEREMVSSLLWGDRFEAQARQSLRQALLALRKDVGSGTSEVFQIDEETLSLPADAVRVDATEFERLARDGNLEDAARAYDGDLREGLSVRSEPFDTWLAEERARLHEIACEVWATLGDRRLQDGNAEAAIEAGRHLVSLDPLRESGHRSLIKAYAGAGRRAEALQHYQVLADMLRGELGAEPDPATTRLIDGIREAAGEPIWESPTLASADAWTAEPRAPRPGADRPAIAVMPFVNMSDDPMQAFFADGITEDIITDLAKLGSFGVIARNSAFEYKGRSVNVGVIGRELGVEYLIEGGVRKDGKQVRITAQLVVAATGKHLWAERYDREVKGIFKGVFAIQDEVTQAIVVAVEAALQRAA